MGKTSKSSKTDKVEENKPGKVVSFSGNQKKNTSAKGQKQEYSASNSVSSTSSSELPYDGVNSYKALLEFQAQVMDELHQMTEDMLQELHYPADKFVLNEDSAMEFLDANMYEFVGGIGESLDLVFDAEIDGKRYKTLASAFFRGDHIEMDGTICKYDEKNDDWLVYTGENNEWEIAPEEVVDYLRDY